MVLVVNDTFVLGLTGRPQAFRAVKEAALRYHHSDVYQITRLLYYGNSEQPSPGDQGSFQR